ncbi:hypothetical protein JB92DRAFT_3050450 [Gautieria morchelliformis]|nr:hypothetical protein JB92DRAFT_3050450 [Gautieria morchelliformis]
MQVFRNRARRGHHDHHTDVPITNATRVITTNNGHSHGHRGGATVITVPATRVSSRHSHRHPHVATTGARIISTNDGHGHSHRGGGTVLAVPAAHASGGHGHRGNTTVIAADVPNGHGHAIHATSSRDYHRYYRDDPSTVHGLWNKVLGTLTGNRRRRRHGDREMRKARERRDALRIARGVQRDHTTGHLTKLRKFRDSHRRRHHDHQEPVVITQEGRRERTPWLHHHHRSLPPYHGMHHTIMGFFTGGKERRARGKAMAVAAEEERRRERRHRRKEMEDLGRRYRTRR